MSFPRYPEYKDSEVTWLGELPAHWGIQRIKNTTYLKGRVGWKGLTSEEYLEDGYAYLVTGTDFSKRFINWNDCHCVERERYEDDPFIQLRNGDLLITKDGTIGKLALVKDLDRPACLNSGIFLIRPECCYTTDYMYWVLSSQAFVSFCDLSSFGSTIQHLYQNVFERFSFPIPPRQEQSEIAGFLDREISKIDSLVEEQQRLMDLLTEKVASLVLSSMCSSETQEIRLENAAAIIARPVNQQEGELYTPLGLFNRGRGLFHKDVREMADMGDSDFFWLEEGDLILSGQFAWEGAVALAGKEEAGCVVSHRYPVLRGKPGIALTEYLLALFTTKHGDFLLNENSRGAAGRNRPLNINSLLKEKISVADMNIQEKVAEAVHAKNKLFTEIAKEVELLKERRSALISAAVTGKIDVRGWAEQEAA